MKFFAYLLCFYLFALTALPSVRAIKMQLSQKCQSACQKMNSDKEEQSGCQKGKIIMNLSFNPVYYETFQSISNCTKIIFVDLSHKENNSYKEVFISQYKSSIWQPPKIFSVV